MPNLPPVSKVIKISVVTGVTVHPTLQWRFFIQYTGTAPTQAQINTFAGSVGTQFANNMIALFSTNVAEGPITCTDLSSGGLIGVDTTGRAGTRAGTEAPTQSAVEIRFQITRRYRGGKPKCFLNAGVQGDQADVSHWSVALANAVTTGFNGMITGIVAAGWTGAGTLSQVAVSYYSGFVPVSRAPFRTRNVNQLRATPLIDPVTSIVVPTMMASQRRRRAVG